MKRKFDQIFSILENNDPNPKTELNSENEFTLLVAIVLSAQSTDVGVNKATTALFTIVKTAQDLHELGIEGLKPYIKTLGLYNSKAKHLIALAEQLLDKDIPNNVTELEKLPGVGSKTARVFLNCARQAPLIAVDTHVFRVSLRLGIATGKNVKQVEDELNKNIPKKWKLYAHHWIILHGRYICKARKPECLRCPISKYCNDFNMTASTK